MNSLTKNLFSHYCLKQVSLYKFFRNEVKFISARYCTFINTKSAGQSEIFVPKSTSVCKVFTLTSFKEGWATLSAEFNNGLRNLFPSQKHKHIGYLWYNSLEAVQVQEFFSLLEMPDTFYSRFKVMELHVWMLLFHLPQANRLDKLIRYGLMEAMWVDTEKRASIVEKYNINFRKNMKTFYFKFKRVPKEVSIIKRNWRNFSIDNELLENVTEALPFSRMELHRNVIKKTLLLYDEGFFGDDRALTNALWLSFFDRDNVDPRVIETLVSYVRHQMNYMNDLNFKLLEDSDKDKIWSSLKPHAEKIFKSTK